MAAAFEGHELGALDMCTLAHLILPIVLRAAIAIILLYKQRTCSQPPCQKALGRCGDAVTRHINYNKPLLNGTELFYRE